MRESIYQEKSLIICLTQHEKIRKKLLKMNQSSNYYFETVDNN